MPTLLLVTGIFLPLVICFCFVRLLRLHRLPQMQMLTAEADSICPKCLPRPL